jgi:hypothetical protein
MTIMFPIMNYTIRDSQVLAVNPVQELLHLVKITGPVDGGGRNRVIKNVVYM